MRLLPVLSVFVAAAATLSDPASAASSVFASEPRALAASTTAPPATSSASSDAADAAAMATLRKYYGEDIDKLTEQQQQQLIDKIKADTNNDPSALEKLFEDSKDWLAKVGGSIKAIFVGKDDTTNDGGVFGTIWKSLFGKDSQAPTNGTTTATNHTHGSGTGSMGTDVGHSGSMDTTIEETDNASSGSKEDTSIDTVAPTATKTNKSTTAPKSSSRAKLLTSLPVAGTVAAIFVINFLQ